MPQRPPAHCSPIAAFAASCLLSAAAVASSSPSARSVAPPAWVVQHAVPRAVLAWRPLALSVVLPGEHPLVRADLFYREPGASSYTGLPLRENGGVWTARVPAGDVVPPALEYYLRLQGRDGTIVTRPEADAARAPYTVRVLPEADSSVTILSPAPGEIADGATPQIAAFFDPPLRADEACSVWLDDKPVQADTDSARDYVSVVPASPLPAGEHIARIEIDGAGPAPRVQSWSFTVAAGEFAAAGTSTPASSGRVSLGVESASGAAYTGTVLRSLPEPPGTYLAASGDMSAIWRSGTLTGWLSSTPSISPRTQGALLLTDAGREVEAGSLLLWESELALAGPQATGGRFSVQQGPAEVHGFGVHIRAEDAGTRAIDGGTLTALARVASGTQIGVLGGYAAESQTDVVDFVSSDARSGWTLAPRATLDRGGWQGLAEWSAASWTTRPGAPRDSSGSGQALLLSAVHSEGAVRASARYSDIGQGYHALLAPFAEAGRRELSTSATVTQGVWSATGSYFLSRFAAGDSGAPVGWSHRVDASLSRLDSQGQGATLAWGRQDGAWYSSLSGSLARGATRASATLTRSHVFDTTTWTGSSSVHARPVPRLTTDLAVSAALTQQHPAGEASATLSRSLLPRLTVAYQIDSRDQFEGFVSTSSYATSLFPADLGGTRILRTFHQTVARVSYQRSW